MNTAQKLRRALIDKGLSPAAVKSPAAGDFTPTAIIDSVKTPAIPSSLSTPYSDALSHVKTVKAPEYNTAYTQALAENLAKLQKPQAATSYKSTKLPGAEMTYGDLESSRSKIAEKAQNIATKTQKKDQFWENIAPSSEEVKTPAFSPSPVAIPEISVKSGDTDNIFKQRENADKKVSQAAQGLIGNFSKEDKTLVLPKGYGDIEEISTGRMLANVNPVVGMNTRTVMGEAKEPMQKEIKTINDEISTLDSKIAQLKKENQDNGIYARRYGKSSEASKVAAEKEISSLEAQRSELIKKRAEKQTYQQQIESIEKIAVYADYQKLLDEDPEAYRRIIDGKRIDGNDTMLIGHDAFLTDDEKNIYYYLRATQGKIAAQGFLDFMDSELRFRDAEKYYNDINRGDAAWLKKAATVFVGNVANSVSGIAGGVKQFFSDTPVEQWELSDAAAYIQEKEDGFGGFAYDVLGLVGHMTPSMLAAWAGSTFSGLFGATVSTAANVGKAAGAATTYLSASGNAYAEKIKQGYSPDEARIYANLVGASEAGLQYALGGISKLGRNANTGLIAQKIAGIENAFARASAELAHRGFKEIAEEELQLFVEPFITSMVFDEEYTAPEFEEMLYTALLSFASTGVFEISDVTKEGLNQRKNNKMDKELGTWLRSEGTDADGDVTRAVIGEGLESAAGTDSRTYAEKLFKRTNAGKTVSDRQLGHMYRANVDAINAENNTASAPETVEKNYSLNDSTQAPSSGYLVDTTPAPILHAKDIKGDPVENAQRYNVLDTQTLAPKNSLEQSVVDSAVDIRMNNFADTRSLVETAMKISAESSVPITFTTTERLKNMGYDTEKYNISGLYSPRNGIFINAESPKAGQAILGHELVHWLKSNGLYDSYSQAITAYANEIGTYQKTYDSVTSLYKTVKNADYGTETVAELTGEYLFTDEAFVSKLAEHRNLFQRVYDKIRHYYNMAVAGSPEARLLEKAKYTFERAYRAQSGKTQNHGNGTDYDIVYLDNGKMYVQASRKVINGNTTDERKQDISKFFGELLDRSESIDIQTIERDILTITKKDTAWKAEDDYKSIGNQRIRLSEDEFFVKLQAEAHIDELVEVARANNASPVPDRKKHDFAKDGFTYRTVFFRDLDGRYYKIRISIGHNGRVATVYNVTPKKEGSVPAANIIAAVGSKPYGTSPSDAMLTQNNQNVNSEFSLSQGSVKEQQFRIIQDTNPAPNTYQTWIRSADDVKTLAETLEDPDWEYEEINPDLTRTDIENAIDSGVITVYSSHPIKNGVFVTPSRMEAESYSGNGKVYQKTVDINNVAWIDPTQGQYAEIDDVDFSLTPKESQAGEVTPVEANNGSAVQTDVSTEDFGKLSQMGKKQIAETPYDSSGMISTQPAKKDKGLWQGIKDGANFLNSKLIDSGLAITKIGKTIGDDKLYGYYNMARSSQSIAAYMVLNNATNVNGQVTGKSLTAIFEPIHQRGKDYYREFQEYLYHVHNVDRMSLQASETDLATVSGAFSDFQKEHAKDLEGYTPAKINEIAYDSTHDLHEVAKEYVKLARLSDETRARKNKPVFGPDANGKVPDAKESRAISKYLLAEHPEFAKYAKEVYDYIDNLMNYRISSGLVTPAQAAMLKKTYPHYVPTFRVTKKGEGRKNKNKAEVGSTIGKAEGGTTTLMPIEQALVQLTGQVVHEGTKNLLGTRILDDVMKYSGEGYENSPIAKYVIEEPTEADYFNKAEYYDDTVKRGKKDKSTTNTFVVYKDGKRWEMHTNGLLYEAVSALDSSATEGLNLMAKTNSAFKKLITEYNPAFLVRNGIKDIQEVLFNSKDLRGFTSNYPSAIKEIATNGKYWQAYQALGGLNASLFNSPGLSSGTSIEIAEGVKKIVDVYTLANVNRIIEQLPRFAEFMSTVKKNGGLENANMDILTEAMYNAAEVTTNFGRGGQWTKALNKYAVPFLNPAVQGANKAIRNIWNTRGFKAWTKLILKGIIFGCGPILNDLLYEDDEDYEAISDEIKANYYLFKYGDGKFVKIPKGRYISALNYTFRETVGAFKGEGFDAWDTVKHVYDQVGVADPLTNNFIMPFLKVSLTDDENPGETWYGSDIEGQSLQDLPVAERYDARTDELSKLIGKTFNVSPKKINYLLNQYGGVLADVFLPMLTPAAENDLFTANFTLDSTASNKYSGEYYDAKKKADYSANSIKATPYDTLSQKYWSNRTKGISEVNKAIRQIEADESLSDNDKKELLHVQYGIRNGLYKTALDSSEEFDEVSRNYYDKAPYKDAEDKLSYAFAMATRDIFGAEYALSSVNKTAYEEAAELASDGVSYDKYFDAYFEYDKIKADNKDTKVRKTEFAHWLNNNSRGMTDSERAALREALIGEGETSYDKLVGAGVSDDAAYSLGLELDSLEPDVWHYHTTVQPYQKYRAIIDAGLSEEQTLAAMKAVSSESQAKKIEKLASLGIDLKHYVSLAETVGEAGKSIANLSNAELKMWIERMPLPVLSVHSKISWPKIKTTLYEVLSGSTKTERDTLSRLRESLNNLKK